MHSIALRSLESVIAKIDSPRLRQFYADDAARASVLHSLVLSPHGISLWYAFEKKSQLKRVQGLLFLACDFSRSLLDDFISFAGNPCGNT